MVPRTVSTLKRIFFPPLSSFIFLIQRRNLIYIFPRPGCEENLGGYRYNQRPLETHEWQPWHGYKSWSKECSHMIFSSLHGLSPDDSDGSKISRSELLSLTSVLMERLKLTKLFYHEVYPVGFPPQYLTDPKEPQKANEPPLFQDVLTYIFPSQVLMISIHNRKIRLIQAHFDGKILHLQCSSFLDFPSFDKPMFDFFLRWVISNPVGDTKIPTDTVLPKDTLAVPGSKPSFRSRQPIGVK